MKLILVRHGETKWNHEKRVVGHTGMALNNNGRKQVGLLAQALKDKEVSCIYSSPLKRARETADAIARAQGLHVVTVDALKEVDAGELEGLTFNEVVERYGVFFQEWIKDTPSLKIPGGESITDLRERTWPAVQRIVREHPGEAVIAVSHNLAILSIISRALGMNISDFRRLRLSVASISVLDFGEHFTSLVLFNDTCHLESGG
jgi:broad specificity phosphatase PhoE